MSSGIRIAKDAQDISTVKPEELYVDSDTPLFKLFMSGKGRQAVIGTVGEQYNIVITHNLGYIPFYLIYADRDPGNNKAVCTTFENTNAVLPTGITAFVSNVTENTITLQYGTGGATPINGIYTYSYFIYYDKLSGV